MTVDGVRDWLATLASVRLVPAAERNGAVCRAEAMTLLGCAAEALDALVHNGLPTVPVAGEPRFDSRDIFNLAFNSTSRRSIPRLVLAAFARIACQEPEDWLRERRWWIAVTMSCPAGDACTGGRWLLTQPSAQPWDTQTWDTQPWDSTGRGPVRHTFDLGTRGARTPLVSPALREIYAEVCDTMSFQLLPRSLKTDVAALTQAGTADCDGLSEIIVSRYRFAGYAAAVVHGIPLVPFGFGHHTWSRVLDDDGVWKHVDPSLPMLARKGGADVPEFREACGCWRLNRVVECQPVRSGLIAWHTCAASDAEPTMRIRAVPAGGRDD